MGVVPVVVGEVPGLRVGDFGDGGVRGLLVDDRFSGGVGGDEGGTHQFPQVKRLDVPYDRIAAGPLAPLPHQPTSFPQVRAIFRAFQ